MKITKLALKYSKGIHKSESSLHRLTGINRKSISEFYSALANDDFSKLDKMQLEMRLKLVTTTLMPVPKVKELLYSFGISGHKSSPEYAKIEIFTNELDELYSDFETRRYNEIQEMLENECKHISRILNDSFDSEVGLSAEVFLEESMRNLFFEFLTPRKISEFIITLNERFEKAGLLPLF